MDVRPGQEDKGGACTAAGIGQQVARVVTSVRTRAATRAAHTEGSATRTRPNAAMSAMVCAGQIATAGRASVGTAACGSAAMNTMVSALEPDNHGLAT